MIKNIIYIVLGFIYMASTGCNASTIAGRDISEFFSDPNIISFVHAAEDGDEVKIKSMVNSGINVNSVGKNGITPLIWLVLLHNHDGIRGLLKNGADPNQATFDGDSALTLAARIADNEMLNLILEHGGDPNAFGSSGDTALILTIRRMNWDNMRSLLKHGADMNKMDIYNNNTPMVMAATLGQYEQVYYFLESGADYSITNRNDYRLANKLSLPIGDASPWKKKVQSWLEDKGIKFPYPKPKREKTERPPWEERPSWEK